VGTKRYAPWTPEQPYLLPPSPRDWLPKEHLVYFLLDVVQRLDLGPIERAIGKKDPRGTRPYSPRLMVAVLIYGYAVGIYSSRKLERATHEDVAFRVLTGGAHPHFTSINAFRLQHRETFAELFTTVLRLCKRAGLVKLGHVALDGTKILANASKHKAMSYERMGEEEARLRGEVNELLAHADDADRADDARYGVGVKPVDVPAELVRREERIARIEDAMAELEREATETRAEALRDLAAAQWERASDAGVDTVERDRAANRAAKGEALAAELDPPKESDDDDEDDAPPPTDVDLPNHRTPATKEGKPTPKAQRNFTDGDSRIMVANGAFVQAYNAQAAVDGKAQVIVACAVTNQSPDTEHLVPLVERIEENCARWPVALSADNGYLSQANVAFCESRGVDAHISVGRTPHGRIAAERREPPWKRALRAKLESEEGHELYSRRKTIVEPVFGQIKGARGFRRFSLRGLLKVRCEWALVCLVHNLLKLFRPWQANMAAAQAS
jgi:transposase